VFREMLRINYPSSRVVRRNDNDVHWTSIAFAFKADTITNDKWFCICNCICIWIWNCVCFCLKSKCKDRVGKYLHLQSVMHFIQLQKGKRRPRSVPVCHYKFRKCGPTGLGMAWPGAIDVMWRSTKWITW